LKVLELWSSAVYGIPRKLTSSVVKEASTIPLTVLAAALPLFRRQSLPSPWDRRSSNAPRLPLIIYGASSGLGTFAVKLARLSNIHPIIAIAGSSSKYVDTFLDQSLGDTLIDYRIGPENIKIKVKEALNGLQAHHALDAVCENQSWVMLAQMLADEGGTVSVVQGSRLTYDEPDIPENVRISYSYVGTAHTGQFGPKMPKQPDDKDSVRSDIEFSYVLFKYLARMMARGEFEGHPYEVIPGGLSGVETGLHKLQKGEARGVKYIYRIGETA
jgi:NADPH:quinone reductase